METQCRHKNPQDLLTSGRNNRKTKDIVNK